MLSTHILHLHALAFPLQDASAETQSICAPVKALRDADAPHPSPLPPALCCRAAGYIAQWLPPERVSVWRFETACLPLAVPLKK